MKKKKEQVEGVFKCDRLLDSREVSEILGIKLSTLSNWVSERRIPFVKLGPGKGAMVKFEPHKLNEWIEAYIQEPVDLASFTI